MLKSKLLPLLIVGSLVLTACPDDDESVMMGPGAEDTFTQVDRVGIPALNTVFNHPPAFSKTAYNIAGPANDLSAYRSQFETVLGAVANADPSATTGVLLPDVLPVNLGSAASNFANLDGRKPEDDATDIALSVYIGPSLSSLHSDNVDANDVAFPTTFPYLAPAH